MRVLLAEDQPAAAWVVETGLRERGLQMPVLMLTARNAVQDLRIPEHRDHRFQRKVIVDSGILITDSGDREH